MAEERWWVGEDEENKKEGLALRKLFLNFLLPDKPIAL